MPKCPYCDLEFSNAVLKFHKKGCKRKKMKKSKETDGRQIDGMKEQMKAGVPVKKEKSQYGSTQIGKEAQKSIGKHIKDL